MAKLQKVVLFIVEGITDEYALYEPLQRIHTANNVAFHVVHGDITSDSKSTTQNIKGKLGKIINSFLDTSKVQRSDLQEIVHLIDTDGAFIDEKHIIFNKEHAIIYSEDYIFTHDINNIVERNKRKKSIIKTLFTISEISSVKYSIYYFSRNREHVFNGITTYLTNEEKMDIADTFSEKFVDDQEGFLLKLQEAAIADIDDYTKSWENIFGGVQSLKRCSNFYIYFTSLGDENT